MKAITVFSLIALCALIFSAVNSMNGGISVLEISTADAGPLAKRLESKHLPSPRSQGSMQGGDSEARQQCIEMLHEGDHEGAQNCIAQLQNVDSDGTQVPADQMQPASQPSAAPSPSTVQIPASGSQGDLYDAREKCAEMLRSGNHAGARECIRQLRN